MQPATSRLAFLTWLLPLLVAAAVYLPSAFATGWILDDTVNLAQHAAHGNLLGEWTQPTYAHAGGSSGHIWRPIPATLQHATALLFGRRPPVFRLLNLLIHLINIGLVYRLARALTARAPAAGLLTLCFALHPALPEAVCWSSDVYDLALATSLLCITGLLVQGSSGPVRWAGTAVGLLLACLCKETALAFVPMVGLLALLRHGWRDALVSTAAAACAAVVYLLAHSAVTSQGYGAVGGQSPLAHQAAAWLTTSGWLLLLPDQAGTTHVFDPEALAGPFQGLATLALLGVLAALAWRRQRKVGQALLLASFTWALLLAPTGPAIPMVGLHSFRYVYAPLALVAAMVAPSLAVLPARIPRWAPALLLLAWCGAHLPYVSSRPAAWIDAEQLFEAELDVEPDNRYAKAQLARTRVVSGKDVRASLALWAEALEGPAPRTRLLDPFSERWDLAKSAFLRGHPELAIAQTRRLLADCEQSEREPPKQAWCLVADALDALDRHHEASEIDHLCPTAAAGDDP